MTERRVILLGKTGNGKSSTGNSILGDNIFKANKSANSVTSHCAVHTREREGGRTFTVCDTPGLFCHGEDPIEMSLKIQKSVELCPKPHAFLFVFSSANRMTPDEKYTITLLRVIFGDKMFDNCIVVITRGNEFETDSDFVDFWKGNDELKELVESCGNRVVKMENDAKTYTESTGLESLLEIIEQMAKYGTYDYTYLKDHSEVLQEYKITYGVSKSEDMDKHLNGILNAIRKRLEEKERKVDEERKQQEDLKRQVIDQKETIGDLQREIANSNSTKENLYAIASGLTNGIVEGCSTSLQLVLSVNNSLQFGGGFPGSSSFGRL